jgi:hypothetical protein
MGTTTPFWTVFVTAGAALFGAGIGAWIPFFSDKRTWQREHEKHWQDTRLETYKEFLTAHREYLAYVMLDSTIIEARSHPRYEEMIPFFDAEGRPVRQRQEPAFTALRLVAMSQQTETAMVKVVTSVRQVACARAEHDPKNILSELFAAVSRYEEEFIVAARREMGLSPPGRSYGSKALPTAEGASPVEMVIGAIPGDTIDSQQSGAAKPVLRS